MMNYSKIRLYCSINPYVSCHFDGLILANGKNGSEKSRIIWIQLLNVKIEGLFKEEMKCEIRSDSQVPIKGIIKKIDRISDKLKIKISFNRGEKHETRKTVAVNCFHYNL